MDLLAARPPRERQVHWLSLLFVWRVAVMTLKVFNSLLVFWVSQNGSKVRERAPGAELYSADGNVPRKNLLVCWLWPIWLERKKERAMIFFLSTYLSIYFMQAEWAQSKGVVKGKVGKWRRLYGCWAALCFHAIGTSSCTAVWNRELGPAGIFITRPIYQNTLIGRNVLPFSQALMFPCADS